METQTPQPQFQMVESACCQNFWSVVNGLLAMRCTKDSNALLLKGLKNSGEVCRSIITTLECIREEVIYGHILELFVLIFGPHGSLELPQGCYHSSRPVRECGRGTEYRGLSLNGSG